MPNQRQRRWCSAGQSCALSLRPHPAGAGRGRVEPPRLEEGAARFVAHVAGRDRHRREPAGLRLDGRVDGAGAVGQVEVLVVRIDRQGAGIEFVDNPPEVTDTLKQILKRYSL